MDTLTPIESENENKFMLKVILFWLLLFTSMYCYACDLPEEDDTIKQIKTLL